MPYIEEEERKKHAVQVAAGHSPTMEKVGELNYELTLKALKFADEHGHSYTTYNAIVGALECAKLEFYRRMAVPHENLKQLENGDIKGYAEQEKRIQKALSEHFSNQKE